MQKTHYVIILGAGALLLAVFCALNAQAAITVSDVEKTITLTTATYTLDDVWASPSVGNDNLTNYTDGTWRANYSIIVSSGTLLLNPDDGDTGCTWLKLATRNESGKENSHITVLGTGRLFVNDTMITGWDNSNDANNTEYTDFRPYIYIYSSAGGSPQPYAQFKNSTIGYLGFNADNKYGIVYESLEEAVPTGFMHNCTVMENYQGINIQGTPFINVTNSWFNDTISAGIVYTTSGGGESSDGCYIGDHPTWTHRAAYTGVKVIDCDTLTSSDGIRLVAVSDLIMNGVIVDNCKRYGIDASTDIDAMDWDNVVVSGCSLTATQANIYLDGVWDSTFDNCSAYSADAGYNWYLDDASDPTQDNEFTDCHSWDSPVVGYYIDLLSNNNTFLRCNASESEWYGFYIAGDYNDFTYCEGNDDIYGFSCTQSGVGNSAFFCWANGTAGVGAGFAIDLNAVDNTYVLCQARDLQYGYYLAGNNANNNTFLMDTATDCEIGIYVAPSLKNVRDNTFVALYLTGTSMYGIYVDGAGITMFASITLSGTGDGVFIKDASDAEFTDVVSYGYGEGDDWIIEGDCDVYITQDYILDGVVNTVGDDSTPYSSYTHAPTGGADTWTNITTRDMTIHMSDQDTATVDMTSWSTSPQYRHWTITATGGAVYQHVGGLAVGSRYNHKCQGTIMGNYIAVAGGLSGGGMTWFNYSGGWSTKNMEVIIYTSEQGGGNGGGSGGAGTREAGLGNLPITILILDTSQIPLQDALVSVYDETGTELFASGFTDQDGIYIIDLNAGTYTIVAEKANYDTQTVTQDITGEATITLVLSTSMLLLYIGVAAVIATIAIVMFFVLRSKKII